MDTEFLVKITKMLALPMERNTSTSALIHQVTKKSTDIKASFSFEDRTDFEVAMNELNKTGRLSRRLLKWLWMLVDITEERQIDMLVELLQVPLCSVN